MARNKFYKRQNCPAPRGVKIGGGADTRTSIEGLPLPKTWCSDFVLGVRPLDRLSRNTRAHAHTRLKESGLDPGHPGQKHRLWRRRLKRGIRWMSVSTHPLTTNWWGVGHK